MTFSFVTCAVTPTTSRQKLCGNRLALLTQASKSLGLNFRLWLSLSCCCLTFKLLVRSRSAGEVNSTLGEHTSAVLGGQAIYQRRHRANSGVSSWYIAPLTASEMGLCHQHYAARLMLPLPHPPHQPPAPDLTWLLMQGRSYSSPTLVTGHWHLFSGFRERFITRSSNSVIELLALTGC